MQCLHSNFANPQLQQNTSRSRSMPRRPCRPRAAACLGQVGHESRTGSSTSVQISLARQRIHVLIFSKRLAAIAVFSFFPNLRLGASRAFLESTSLLEYRGLAACAFFSAGAALEAPPGSRILRISKDADKHNQHAIARHKRFCLCVVRF